MDVLSLEEVYYSSKGLLKKAAVKMAPSGIGIKVAGSADIKTVRAEEIKEIQSYNGIKGHSIRIIRKDNRAFIVDSIEQGDLENIKEYAKKTYKLNVYARPLAVEGQVHGKMDVSEIGLEMKVNEKTLFDIPLWSITNAYDRKGEGIIDVGDEQHGVVEIRFASVGEGAKDASALIETVRSLTGSTDQFELFSLEEVVCVLPRGKCKLSVNNKVMHMIGKTYNHQILYSNITRIFHLERSLEDGAEEMCYLIVEVSTPIRQGQTKYQFILFLLSEEPVRISLGAGESAVAYEDQQEGVEEDTEDGKEGGSDNDVVQAEPEPAGPKIRELGLKAVYEGGLSRCVSEILGTLSGHPPIGAGSFATMEGGKSLKCSCKANEGHLYPLKSGLLFITKIAYIKYADIDVVEFSRINISARTAKTFDARVITKDDREYTFNGIQKAEFGPFEAYLARKGVKCRSEVVNEGWEEARPEEESEEEETASEETSSEEESSE